MKRFNQFIRGLSLSQQMFALIFFSITFFAVFFFVYLNGNVDKVIEQQIFSTLQRTQSNIVASMESDVTGEQLTKSFQDSSLTHLIYYSNGEIKTTNLAKVQQDEDLVKVINDRIQVMLGTTENFVYQGNVTMYCRIMKAEIKNRNSGASSEIILVSMADSGYMETFKNTLVSYLININVIVVSFFFIIMMIWVAGLIHPLNQIRNYIEKIKLGKDAELKITRKDEIGELADALVSMRRELQKQEKTKEDMIHNISHDLKTPIATIKSYGESIKDGIYPYDTLEKSVDVIIDNADRLEKKVHSLLYLNRVEYLISKDCEGVVTNMKEIVERVILNSKVIRPDIVIHTQLEEVYFDGLEESWQVTVENIIENALRYAKTTIQINLDEDNGLNISNDGPCMSDDRMRVLFKPFEKGQDGKFGLGLSIVSKVVKANNYDVSGENTSDGVIFRIHKPTPKK